MKVFAIQEVPATTTTLDLEKFKSELQELSKRHNLQLVSLGAMTTIDMGGAYVAIWSPPEPAK